MQDIFIAGDYYRQARWTASHSGDVAACEFVLHRLIHRRSLQLGGSQHVARLILNRTNFGFAMKAHLLFVTAVVALFVASATAQDIARGLRNYQQIIVGKLKLDQLSPTEQQEVIVVARRMRSSDQKTQGSPECRSATERAESAAEELSSRSKRLQRCAESQDFSDDCSTEFRRVRSAQSDYESAASDVSGSCR